MQLLSRDIRSRPCAAAATARSRRSLDVVATRQRHAHAAVLEGARLGEDPDVDRPSGAPSASASATPSKPKAVALPVGEDDGDAEGPASSIAGIGRPRMARRCSSNSFGILADQRDHAGVVRARAQFGEDRPVAGDEEFDAENAVAAERGDDLARPVPAPSPAPRRHRRRLPAFAIVARFLAVADRRAEQDAILGRDGQQGDLASRSR